MDRFVNTIGEGYLRRREAKVPGNHCLDGLALGITGEVARRDAAENVTHGGRTRQCVLVEVQAETVTTSQRRMILLHAANARARCGVR
jgi:hypothetical protein